MPSRCAVPGCRSNIKTTTDEKTGLFRVPFKDPKLFALWNRAMPKTANGKLLLHEKSKICSIHFQEEDIKKHIKLFIGNETILHDMGIIFCIKLKPHINCINDISTVTARWKLQPGVVPTLFPGILLQCNHCEKQFN